MNLASASSIHYHRRHRHVHRQAQAAPSSSSESAISTPTAASIDKLAVDMQALQTDLTRLPKDLMGFFRDVTGRIDELETLVRGLVGPASALQTEMPQSLVTTTSTATPEPTSLSAPTQTSLPQESVSPQPLSATDSATEPPASATEAGTTSIATNSEPTSLSAPGQTSLPQESVSPQPLSATDSIAEPPASATEAGTTSIATNSEPSSGSPSPPQPNIPPLDLSQGATTNTNHLQHRKVSPSNPTNVAVYYGITPATSSTSLLTLCANPSINIINLSFLTTFFGPNPSNYPTLSALPGCTFPSPGSSSPTLPSCPLLASQIHTCQTLHSTKILLSLGGWGAPSSFPSSASAISFAHTLWSLFGGGGGGVGDTGGTSPTTAPSPRPFGPTLKLDGFDLDNESGNPAHYAEFVTALRKLFATDPSKRYYLSAAPQCPRPDASLPLEVLREVDWVHVQFYNNPACELGKEGFVESVRAWSKDLNLLQAQTGGENATEVEGDVREVAKTGGPLLFVGASAWAQGAGSGYVGPALFEALMGEVKGLGLGNLGGVMLWDGSEGVANVGADGRSFVDVAGRAFA